MPLAPGARNDKYTSVGQISSQPQPITYRYLLRQPLGITSGITRPMFTLQQCSSLLVSGRWPLTPAYVRTHTVVATPLNVVRPHSAKVFNGWAVSSTVVMVVVGLYLVMGWASRSIPPTPLQRPTRHQILSLERCCPLRHLAVARHSTTMF